MSAVVNSMSRSYCLGSNMNGLLAAWLLLNCIAGLYYALLHRILYFSGGNFSKVREVEDEPRGLLLCRTSGNS